MIAVGYTTCCITCGMVLGSIALTSCLKWCLPLQELRRSCLQTSCHLLLSSNTPYKCHDCCIHLILHVHQHTSCAVQNLHISRHADSLLIACLYSSLSQSYVDGKLTDNEKMVEVDSHIQMCLVIIVPKCMM